MNFPVRDWDDPHIGGNKDNYLPYDAITKCAAKRCETDTLLQEESKLERMRDGAHLKTTQI